MDGAVAHERCRTDDGGGAARLTGLVAPPCGVTSRLDDALGRANDRDQRLARRQRCFLSSTSLPLNAAIARGNNALPALLRDWFGSDAGLVRGISPPGRGDGIARVVEEWQARPYAAPPLAQAVAEAAVLRETGADVAERILGISIAGQLDDHGELLFGSPIGGQIEHHRRRIFEKFEVHPFARGRRVVGEVRDPQIGGNRGNVGRRAGAKHGGSADGQGMLRSYVNCSMLGTDSVFFSVRSLNRHHNRSLPRNRLRP